MDRSPVSALRLVLLGDGEWASRSLERLQGTRHEVVAVLQRARPTDSGLADAARRFGIPVQAPARINEPDVTRVLAGLAPDLLVSIAYDQILHAPARAVARHGALNLHAGRLPWYRGRTSSTGQSSTARPRSASPRTSWTTGSTPGTSCCSACCRCPGRTPTGRCFNGWWTRSPTSWSSRWTSSRQARSTCAPNVTTPAATAPGARGTSGSTGVQQRPLHNKIRAITHPGPGARTIAGDAPASSGAPRGFTPPVLHGDIGPGRGPAGRGRRAGQDRRLDPAGPGDPDRGRFSRVAGVADRHPARNRPDCRRTRRGTRRTPSALGTA